MNGYDLHRRQGAERGCETQSWELLNTTAATKGHRHIWGWSGVTDFQAFPPPFWFHGHFRRRKRPFSTYLLWESKGSSPRSSYCSHRLPVKERALASRCCATRKWRPLAEGFLSFSVLCSLGLGAAQQPRGSHLTPALAGPAWIG